MKRPFKPASQERNGPLNGPAFIWRKMCEAGGSGFTVADIEEQTSATAVQTVKVYVMACIEQGFVVRMGLEPRKSSGTFGRRRYRVVKETAKAPVQRRMNYTGERGRARAQLWNAMRILPSFQIAELAASASTEEVQVSFSNARAYTAALLRAGLIVALRPYVKGAKDRAPGARAGLYRLKPSAKSGPLPLKGLRSGIFDPNTETLIPYIEPGVTKARAA